MDFRYNINNILPKRINKITHTLLPEGFRAADRREFNDCQRLLTRIIDDMGEASAKAQGLNRVITNAIKLRDTDHILYLMVESDGNKGLGNVVGLLKTGSKSLFMFDENGEYYQLKPRCILDFYIHESRQRMGLGKELYEHMLKEEDIKPLKLAIDRPSDKFLAFLNKHYGLKSIIPQNNKFVVFKGFFSDEVQESESNNPYSSLSPNRQYPERIQAVRTPDIQSTNNESINGSPVTRSAFGRYAAPRPICSMGNIIHNAVADQPGRSRSRSRKSSAYGNPQDRPDFLSMSNPEDGKENNCPAEEPEPEVAADEPDRSNNVSPLETEKSTDSIEDKPAEEEEEQTPVVEDSKTNEVANKLEDMSMNDNASVCSDSSAYTSAGHLDLKFYHSRLW